MPDRSFRREERLKSRKVIQQLFREGHSFAQHPLRLVWLPVEERRSAYPVLFAPSVSKRNFKRAVNRNRIRRLVREAYRLNKHRLYAMLPEEDRQYALMVLYIAREELPFREIERAMAVMLRRFARQARKNNGQP